MSSAAPLPAATVVLTRTLGASFEVFLVKRHSRAGFLANAHVFPGGRVDEHDLRWASFAPDALLTCASALLDDALPAGQAAGFALAAIRECAEECGVVLATDDSGRLAVGDVAAGVTAKLRAGDPFLEVLAAQGLQPAIGALAPLAWWITPEAEPRRFDTRFYLASLPAGQEARCDQRETVAGDWFTPAAALDAYRAGAIHLAPPTLATLEDLAGVGDEGAARDLVLQPLRPICPLLVAQGDDLVLALPGDPLHPVRARAQRHPRTRIVREAKGCFRSLALSRAEV